LTLTLPEGSDVVAVSATLAAGRFGTTLHDQLVVAYAVGPDATVKVITVDFDAQGKPVQKATKDLGVTLGEFGKAWLRSGQFDWGGPFDQAALFSQLAPAQGRSISAFRILSFDANLNPTVGPQPQMTGNGQACTFDMAVGNFDRMQPNPSPPPATQRDPNLQLALLASDCGTNVYVNIFNVDPAHNFAVTRVSPDPGLAVPSAEGTPMQMSLAAADMQGHSLRGSLSRRQTPPAPGRS
jgi:hypothetical protein